MEVRKASRSAAEGTDGWDQYAPFYDWENARTLGRRDVGFWRGVALREAAPLLELGCGTGRLLAPIARAGAAATGVDQSEAMLAYARRRFHRVPRGRRPQLIRADVRALPFASRTFGIVLAAYGLLQSLTRERDLDAALAETARVLRPGGLFGVDLVPDLPAWQEYDRQVRLSGRTRRGTEVVLRESVRQDRRRGLTIFDEEFTEQVGSRRVRRKFTLTFRTVSLPRMVRRLERRGFQIEALLGDYRGRPWDPRAQVWVILARVAD